MSHRATLAKAAIENGYRVTVVTQTSIHADTIRALGVDLVTIPFPRSLKRPWQDIATLCGITRAYRRIQPDIVHHVSLKPVFFGSFLLWSGVARKSSVAAVNAFTGLGYVFTSNTGKTNIVKKFVITLLKILLKQDYQHLLFQNQDDLELLRDAGIANEQNSYVIAGSGVDTANFLPTEEPQGPVTCMLVARMLYDKGVEEFVRAAEIVHRQNPNIRFVLVGDTDTENPSGISKQQLESWSASGYLEWWGKCADMPGIYAQSHMVVLPSYREGFPKVLIEAAACARPVITTDVPGCRDAVMDGKTGKLVPAKDADALAAAILELSLDPEKRKRMGEAGRKLVQEKFSTEVINSQILQLYNDILHKKSTHN